MPGLGAGKEAPIKIRYHTPVACAVTERSERRRSRQGLRPVGAMLAAIVSQARQTNKISLARPSVLFVCIDCVIRMREGCSQRGCEGRAKGQDACIRDSLPCLSCKVLAIYT